MGFFGKAEALNLDDSGKRNVSEDLEFAETKAWLESEVGELDENEETIARSTYAAGKRDGFKLHQIRTVLKNLIEKRQENKDAKIIKITQNDTDIMEAENKRQEISKLEKNLKKEEEKIEELEETILWKVKNKKIKGTEAIWFIREKIKELSNMDAQNNYRIPNQEIASRIEKLKNSYMRIANKIDNTKRYFEDLQNTEDIKSESLPFARWKMDDFINGEVPAGDDYKIIGYINNLSDEEFTKISKELDEKFIELNNLNATIETNDKEEIKEIEEKLNRTGILRRLLKEELEKKDIQ